MNIQDFDYELPKELIAQEPLKQRDSSKLLVVNRSAQQLHDAVFSDLADLFLPGDCLVMNDTKVMPARLIGKKKTGGKVELLALEPYEAETLQKDEHLWSMGEKEDLAKKKIWRCLVQPAPKEGLEILFDGALPAKAVFLKRDEDGVPLVEFKEVQSVEQFLAEAGQMPLPPYIKRDVSGADFESYQTVYAKNRGAVAAPTAGLHFTTALLERIKQKGVLILQVTLHVGYGTFKPVDDLENHKMHSERFELSAKTAEAINQAKARGSKIWAVGTTTLRVLETCVQNKQLIAGRGQTDLFIREPFEFEAVDRLITNFHLPKTTLLLLVSAFMGESLRKKAYQHAIKERYRFYSYGDAMVII